MDDLPVGDPASRPHRSGEQTGADRLHGQIADRRMINARTAQVCLVEDDDIMGESLVDRFTLEGFSCDWHKSARSAASDLKEKRYDVVVSDIRLPDRDGDDLFEELQAEQLYVPPWIFITGYGTIERAIALMKLGAADYVTKPFDLDQLVEKLRAYVPESPHDDRLPTLGLSPGMRRIEDMLPRLATQSTSVLITGQSGVGKEVVAREIHRLDKLRAGNPFVAVNCGGIPENLLEAELFGHERGAFTGAMRLKHGLLEQASRRYAVPGRDRRHAARDAGEAPSCRAGANRHPAWRGAERRGRLPADLCDPPRPPRKWSRSECFARICSIA